MPIMMKKLEKVASTQEEDIHLIRKVAQRDSAAFAAFYDRAALTVFTFLSHLLKNRVESEDILQETFWQVWRQSVNFDPDQGSPIVWVLTMARSLGVTRLTHLSISHQDDQSPEETSIDPHFLGTLSQVVPPIFIRANLLNTVEQEKSITPRLPVAPPAKQKSLFVRFPWPMAILWAITGISAAILFININADRQVAERQNSEISSLRLTLSEKEEAENALRLSLSEKGEALALVFARETLTVALTGGPSENPVSPNALSKVFWNPQMNTGLFIAFDLPIPPNGKVYQLWAVQKGVSVDAGVFLFSMGTGSFKVKPIPNSAEAVQLFTITAEPAGGSPTPTGEILLKGEVVSQR